MAIVSGTIQTGIEYHVVDHSSSAIETITHGFEHLGHAAEHTKERVKEFGKESLIMAAGAVGLGFGFERIGDKILELGKELDEVKDSLSGTLFATLAFDKGAEPLERMAMSQKFAAETAEQLEGSVIRFATPLKDMADAYNMVALSAGSAGLSQEKVQKITEGVAAASKLFFKGAPNMAGVAGDMIGKAILTGNVKATGELGKYLTQHLPKNFKHLSQAARAEKLDKLLDPLKVAAQETTKSLGENMFRIQESIGRIVRAISAPVFQKVSDMIGSWAEHLADASENGKPLLEEYGQKLLSAFETIGDITKTIFEHWKEIAAIWATYKVASGVAGIAGGLGSAAGGFGMSGLAGQLAGFSGALSNVIPIIGGLAIATAAASAAMEKVADTAASKRVKGEGLENVVNVLADSARTAEMLKKHGLDEGQRASASEHLERGFRIALDDLKGRGLLSDTGKLNREDLIDAMSHAGDDFVSKMGAQLKVIGLSKDSTGSQVGIAMAELWDKYGPPEMKKGGSAEGKDGKPGFDRRTVAQFGDMHITMDFKDQDPDRVFVRFKEKIEGYAENKIHSAIGEKFGPGNG